MAQDRNPDGRHNVTTTGVKLRKDEQAWSDSAALELVDAAHVVVSQAYDQDGNPLISEENATFARPPTCPPAHTHETRACGRTHPRPFGHLELFCRHWPCVYFASWIGDIVLG